MRCQKRTTSTKFCISVILVPFLCFTSTSATFNFFGLFGATPAAMIPGAVLRTASSNQLPLVVIPPLTNPPTTTTTPPPPTPRPPGYTSIQFSTGAYMLVSNCTLFLRKRSLGFLSTIY